MEEDALFSRFRVHDHATSDTGLVPRVVRLPESVPLGRPELASRRADPGVRTLGMCASSRAISGSVMRTTVMSCRAHCLQAITNCGGGPSATQKFPQAGAGVCCS